jgi:hypothetical protein
VLHHNLDFLEWHSSVDSSFTHSRNVEPIATIRPEGL